MTDRAAALISGAVIGAAMLTLSIATVPRGVPGGVTVVIDEDVDDGVGSLRGLAELKGQWQAVQYGLSLPANGRGQIELPVLRNPNTDLSVALWLYLRPGIDTTVSCHADGEGSVELRKNRDLRGEIVGLAGCPVSDGATTVRISAAASAAASSGLPLIVDKIQVLNRRGLWTPPTLVPWLVAPLVIMLLWPSSLRIGGVARAAVASALGAAASLMLPFASALDLPAIPGSLPVIWIVLGLIAVAHAFRPWTTLSEAAPLVFWIIATGALLRWELLQAAVSRPLDPDVTTVFRLLREAQSPYDTGPREPLWIWIAQVFNLLTGQPQAGIRLFSMLSSVAVLVLTFLLVRGRFAMPIVAVIAVALLARHPYLIDASTRGLRTEFYTALLLLMTLLTFARDIPQRTRSSGLLLTPMLLGMTQLNSLLIAVPLLFIAAVKRCASWRVVGASLVIAAVTVTPHLRNNQRVYGDPLWSVNVHAIFYRNHEFVRVVGQGCDGCPTLREIQADAYVGSRTTMMHYIFGMHPLREVVARTATGLHYLFASRGVPASIVLGFNQSPLVAVYLMGLVVLLVRKTELVILPLVAVNFLAFIVPIGLDPRLLMPCAPFFAIATAVGLTAVWHTLQTRSLLAIRDVAL